MFCPKCGQQNPETGKFCRSCGTDLGNVSNALSGTLVRPLPVVDKRGRPISFEGAITKSFTGFAFLVIAIVLEVTGVAGGRFWGFWLLIPAFASLGSGVAQYLQFRRMEQARQLNPQIETQAAFPPVASAVLPPPQTQFVSSESRYRTGDLVPPSVTDNTTRHLEMESESKTMALPKK
jgi:hypothetical protein